MKYHMDHAGAWETSVMMFAHKNRVCLGNAMLLFRGKHVILAITNGHSGLCAGFLTANTTGFYSNIQLAFGDHVMKKIAVVALLTVLGATLRRLGITLTKLLTTLRAQASLMQSGLDGTNGARRKVKRQGPSGMLLPKLLGLTLALIAAQTGWAVPTAQSLPYSANPGVADLTEANGWTYTGIGTDYADTGSKLKFDTTGDLATLRIASAPGTVTFYLKGNSLSGSYLFELLESSDGSSFTTAKSISTGIGSVNTTFSQALLSTTRYIRWRYTTKATGNVGMGTISITANAASVIAITNGSATVSVNSYDVKGTNTMDIVGTMLFSNTTTLAAYTQTAPGSPFGWAQTFSSLQSGVNNILVIGTNTANVRTSASTTITYNPPLPSTASNIVAVTTPAASGAILIGMPVSIVTESWSNHTAQIGYGPTTSGSGWLWFGVTASAGGLGYSANTSFTLPIGTNYIGARWINGAVTNYGWSSAGQINVAYLASPLYVWVSNTPSMLLTTPWNFGNADLNGVTCGAGMSTTLVSSVVTTSCYNNGTINNPGWTETSIGQASGYLSMLSSSSQLVSPAMNFNDTSSERLTFDARTYGGVSAIPNTITVSISIDNGANWTSLGTRTPANSTLTAMSPFDISGYAGTQIKVKLETLSATGTIGVGVRNIAVTGLVSTNNGSLCVDGFSHGATRVDAYSNVTFTINTSTYQTPGFYCMVRRDSTGPRTLDLDFYNGSSWQYASATYELSAAGVWYTIGRSFAGAGAANTAFRLVGYGATGSQLDMQGPVVTAPVPEPMLLGIAGLAVLLFLRRG